MGCAEIFNQRRILVLRISAEADSSGLIAWGAELALLNLVSHSLSRIQRVLRVKLSCAHFRYARSMEQSVECQPGHPQQLHGALAVVRMDGEGEVPAGMAAAPLHQAEAGDEVQRGL